MFCHAVDALKEIVNTLGATYWEFDADSCNIARVGVTPKQPMESETSVGCDCIGNDTVCEETHVVSITLKFLSLPGVLPPQLVKLPYLGEIDLAYNYLSGSIPSNWTSLKLKSMSLLANRLSGEIPKVLADITTLTYLQLEANQFSGHVPPELGKLINLSTLILSSNQLIGELPPTLVDLTNLTDFRINDNNFSGAIPNYIQKWKLLKRLEMHASGLQGPIPSNISILEQLTQLRISDVNGTSQEIPDLSKMTGLEILVFRSCNLTGEIPAYLWRLRSLEMLDLSFNKLVGELPSDFIGRSLNFVFLTGNLLSGDVPESILKEGASIDLSYNNFTWQGPGKATCRSNMNLNINLFKSCSMENNSGILPCSENLNCPRHGCSLDVNCGGDDITINKNGGNIKYKGDAGVQGGAAVYYANSDGYWGFSSTGDFMDDNDFQNTRYVISLSSSNLSELYSTARIAPISLTYFRYCLDNGIYNVKLLFAEIQFTNDHTYQSLGKRLFDIYIQGQLIWKDFNIETEASGVQMPLVKQVNASVTSNILEIRFYWAGKGTTRIPKRGNYGPLVSAISVKPTSGVCSESDGEKKETAIYIVVGVGAFCIIFIFLMAGVLWRRRWFGGRQRKEKDLKELDLQAGSFTLKQIKAATNDFDPSYKIGEGGFGPVYKGLLSDGTIIAVKQLSSKSRQGNREFLNEIGVISCLQHPNLVKLHGCCIEGDQLMLVYEYMENNSLARALFGPEKTQLILDWPTRLKICIGIARGLAFLHEESRLKIVHRDIKATNVLLDKDLNPKISDFGLAKLHEEEKTHISTRIAGTIGYMAPEYALWGYLTYKADVYSFGIVALEIVSGKSNNNYMPSNSCVCLLDWACHLYNNGNIVELIDEKLGFDFSKEEAERMVKVALLCTNASPTPRPTMSEVVGMLEGWTPLPGIILEASTNTEDLRFRALRDYRRQLREERSSGSHVQNPTTFQIEIGSSSISGNDLSEITNTNSKSY
ncbi:Serine-threonine/tyrosine-protein kinase, catalytic domain [Dillenia turbinata]|uniref:non-specific serine/threonine protein kinase n=1 Tax=Dillenia turbinata TaxID=194707 RepID=A0AAN8YZB7_9MAGN